MRVAPFLLVAAAGGCNNPTYLTQDRPLETQGGQAAFDTALYVLPVRQPTRAEAEALVTEQQQKMLPMAVPWAATRDFDIEILWAVTNLDSRKLIATFTL